MAFIVMMAIVSLLNDVTYEGANSMTGAFQKLLGSPTIVIAVVGGVGALLGSSLRILTGYLADRTKKYWLFAILGYAIDLFSVPLLATVPDNGWVLAIVFLLTEKIGKAIKKPAKDTIVSFAATQNGVGKSFAFGELLDQIGATLGPLVLAATYYFRSDLVEGSLDQMRFGFLILGIPAVLSIGVLILAFYKFPHPEQFEREKPAGTDTRFAHKNSFILYIVATCFVAIGFLDSFGLINSTISDLALVSPDYLPLLYSYAMFIDAIAAVVFGFLYDKIGFVSIAGATLLTAPYCFFVFFNKDLVSMFIGLTLWGIGTGAQESVMKSGITDLSGKPQRGRAFGLYQLYYGIFSFGGSLLLGWLFGASTIALCVISTVAIATGAVIYLFSYRARQKEIHNTPTPPTPIQV